MKYLNQDAPYELDVFNELSTFISDNLNLMKIII